MVARASQCDEAPRAARIRTMGRAATDTPRTALAQKWCRAWFHRGDAPPLLYRAWECGANRADRFAAIRSAAKADRGMAARTEFRPYRGTLYWRTRGPCRYRTAPRSGVAPGAPRSFLRSG